MCVIIRAYKIVNAKGVVTGGNYLRQRYEGQYKTALMCELLRQPISNRLVFILRPTQNRKGKPGNIAGISVFL